MAEEKIVNLKINDNIDESTRSVKSLKAQLREAQQEVGELSNKFGDTSKQAIEAAKRAAELKDRIGDAKNLTDAFNPDAKFKAVSSSLTGVAGGFSAVTGAMGLFGTESKEVEKAILRVQSAMALASGLQAVGEARDSFKQLGAVAVNALKGIKSGIAATGIGVLLIALGAIVAYWDDIKEAVSGVSDEQKDLNSQSQKNLTIEQEKLKTIDNQDNVLKLQGKSEKEILAIKQKQVDKALEASQISIKNAKITKDLEVAAAERNFKYLKQILDFAIQINVLPLRAMATPLDLLIKGVNKVSEVLGFGKITALNLNDEITKGAELASKTLTTFVFNPDEVKKKGDDAITAAKNTFNELNNKKAGYILQGKAIDKANAEKAKAASEKAAAAKKAANELTEKQILENAKRKSEEEKAFADEQASAISQLGAIKDAELEKERERKRQESEILVNYTNMVDEEAEKRKQIREAEFAHSQLMLSATANGLEAVSDLLGKNTAAGKATAVAASLINTYAAIAAQLKTAAGSPGAAIPGYAIAQAIATGLAGFAAVKNILKVQVPSGGGGGGSSAGASMSGISATAPTASAPQFNVVGTGGANQVAQAFNNNQQQPIKAYVVSNDVTTAQSLDRNIVKSASLG